MIIDTHTHLLDNDFNNDREETINRAKENGIQIFIEIGYDEKCSNKIFEFVKNRTDCFCSIGVHPHSASEVSDETIKKFYKLATNYKVVAIGEIGLDYYRNLSPKEVQILAFKKQLELAILINKPVVIHCREAHYDMKNILSEYKNLRGIIHSFSGNIQDVKFYTDCGFYLGIGGTLTYINNAKTKDVIKNTDINHIVLETDCPYLPPVPYRGERNEPGYLKFVIQEIANLKQIDVKNVEQITTENARSIFGIRN